MGNHKQLETNAVDARLAGDLRQATEKEGPKECIHWRVVVGAHAEVLTGSYVQQRIIEFRI